MSVTERDHQRLSQAAAVEFLRGMAPSWAAQHGDDARQVARIAAWQADEEYDAGKGKYVTFIYECVRRKLLNYLTHTQRKWQPCLPLDGLTNDGEPLECAIPGDLGRYDERVVSQAEREQMWRLVRRLPAKERQAVRALYGRGQSRDVAAQKIGMAGASVSRLARKGVRRLQSLAGTKNLWLARRCLTPGCLIPRQGLGYCHCCYAKLWQRNALPTHPRLREKTRPGKGLSAVQVETLRLVGEGKATVPELQPYVTISARNLFARLSRLEKWGLLKSELRGHPTGGYQRAWRVVHSSNSTDGQEAR
jgi:RNA polymerase sigma factor (sigma-70 family)